MKGASKSLDRCLFITIVDLFLITLIVTLIQNVVTSKYFSQQLYD